MPLSAPLTGLEVGSYIVSTVELLSNVVNAVCVPVFIFYLNQNKNEFGRKILFLK